MKKDKDQLEKELKKLKQDNQNFDIKVINLKSKIGNLNNEKDILVKDNEILKTMNADLNYKISELEKKLNDILKE